MRTFKKEFIRTPIDVKTIGTLHMNIDKLLKDNNISKTKFCKLMDIPQQNLTKYLRNTYTRIDAMMLIKVCYFFECNIEDFLEYIPPVEDK